MSEMCKNRIVHRGTKDKKTHPNFRVCEIKEKIPQAQVQNWQVSEIRNKTETLNNSHLLRISHRQGRGTGLGFSLRQVSEEVQNNTHWNYPQSNIVAKIAVSRK